MRFIVARLCLAFSTALTSLTISAEQLSAPDVLVTLKPIHSLAAGVMQGIGEPKLLIKSAQSIHHYNLRPSDRRLISDADLIIWVGEGLETFLTPILNTPQKASQTISLIATNSIDKIHIEPPDRGHSHHSLDPHIWLSTHNASVIVKEITERLVVIDPVHTVEYLKNRDQLLIKIKDFEKLIKKQMDQITQPYVTLHNGIRYFEKEFRLNNIASIQTNVDLQPSASHIRHILKLIRNNNVNCLFYNQSEKSPIIDTIKSETNIETIGIDPVGVNIKPGEEAWFSIMNHLSKKLSTCLK